MRRGRLAAVAGLAGAVLAASAAVAATRSATDRESGLRFRLEGRVLTVSLAPQPGREPPDARDDLWGERVRAACSTSYLRPIGRRRAVHVARLWPDGAHHVAFYLGRDISARVKWCIVEERGGGDIGFAAFQPPPGRLLLRTEFEGAPGEPGPRPLVRLRDAQGKVVIDRRARYVDRMLRPGRYRIAVVPEGAQACERRLRIRTTRTVALLVSVDPGRGCAIGRPR